MAFSRTAWIVRQVAAALVVLILAVFAGFGLLLKLRFNPSPPRVSYRTPADALEAQRQDLDYFSKLMALDRSFTPAARAEEDRRIRALEALNQPLDRPHLLAALMQIDALTDNGHSRVFYDNSIRKQEVPVRLAVFSDGIYVMWAKREAADLLGGHVLAIDGIPMDEAMRRMETLRGGTEGWRKMCASVDLVLQDLLYGAGIAPDMQHSAWTVTTPAGATVTRTVQAYQPPSDEPEGFADRWLSSEPLPNLGADWSAYQPDRPLPLSLAQFDTTFRRIRLPGSCAMVVQFKSNADDGAQRIGAFVSATESDMRRQRPCNVILDERFNQGGDYVNTYGFAKKLPSLIRPGGRIFLLTGPMTFSAAITTTAVMKQAGGDRVTILGEPVGDRLQFYSEGNRGCLPHSKICVAYETGKHDYHAPCTDLHDCYWMNYFFPVRVKTLQPDEGITQSFADWKAGRDAVFARAVALAAR